MRYLGKVKGKVRRDEIRNKTIRRSNYKEKSDSKALR